MSHQTIGMKQHLETPKTLNMASKHTLFNSLSISNTS